MNLQNLRWAVFFALLLVYSSNASAVWFEPGIGAGVESTNNAKLNDANKVPDLITATYVGARLIENEGTLTYNASTSLNKHVYTKGSFDDSRYLKLSANADWAMIRDRFNWFLTDDYSQRPIIALNSNTPDNVQDTNVFSFGARINQPVSRRQNFSLTPLYTQYYYEVLLTDNRQFSLTANWNYQLQRLINVGFNLSSRKIDYFERAIANTSFTNLALVINGSGRRSQYILNLGSTSVKRDNGDETSGFSGNINWTLDITARTSFKTLLSTELTDTSSVAFNSADPTNGNGIQVTADVVRNTVASLSYLRDDATFDSRFWLRYNKVEYSNNPLDREIRSLGMTTGHPISRLLKGSLYMSFGRTKQLQTSQLDKRFTIGANLRYTHTRKWHSLLDLKFRKKDSTNTTQVYNEASIFATLVYGFGDVYRPSRAGGS